jgi:CRISPR-associated endonuclease/helicase Cas3
MSDSATSVADCAGLFARAISEAPDLTPHPWQAELAQGEDCFDRLIRIPTGFGKTLGVLTAWLWHRGARDDTRWPRRLVWCLPMRVLVEPTKRNASLWLEKLAVAGADARHITTRCGCATKSS